MANKIYTGNTVSLVVNCDITTTSATRCYLYVTKPGGTSTTWTATAASVTYMVYTATSTDLDISGVYKINAYIQDTTSTSYNFTGETFQMRVYDKGE